MRRSVLVAIVTAALVSSSAFAQARAKTYPDTFAVLNDLNKASTVMVAEQGIVPKELLPLLVEPWQRERDIPARLPSGKRRVQHPRQRRIA